MKTNIYSRNVNLRGLIISTNNTLSKNLYDIIAKTGDYINPLGNITGFEYAPSINDNSLVAFVGQFGSILITDLLVENGQGVLTNITPNTVETFSTAVQINNNNKVVARDERGNMFAIRVWNFNPLIIPVVMGTGG